MTKKESTRLLRSAFSRFEMPRGYWYGWFCVQLCSRGGGGRWDHRPHRGLLQCTAWREFIKECISVKALECYQWVQPPSKNSCNGKAEVKPLDFKMVLLILSLSPFTDSLRFWKKINNTSIFPNNSESKIVLILCFQDFIKSTVFTHSGLNSFSFTSNFCFWFWCKSPS